MRKLSINRLPLLTRTLSILSLASLASTATADLIHHWDFDEGSGVTAADSAGSNDGVISGGATWSSDAVRPSFLIFDGTDDSIDPGLILPLMTATNDFTWAFWVNSQEEINGVQQNSIIVGNRTAGNVIDFVPRQFIKFTPQQFEWHQNDVGTDNVVYDNLVVGEWHHMAIVKTGASVQYYRDGIAVGDPGVVTALIDAMPFFIGGEPTHNNREHFNGFIDDVRLYDEALDAASISSLVTPEIKLTDIDVNSDGDVTLTWTSVPGEAVFYSVDFSADLETWENYDDSIPSGGSTSSITIDAEVFPLDSDPPTLCFRVGPAE